MCVVPRHTSTFSMCPSSSQQWYCQAQLGFERDQACKWWKSSSRSSMVSRWQPSTTTTSCRTTSRSSGDISAVCSATTSSKGYSTTLSSGSCNSWTTSNQHASNVESSTTCRSLPHCSQRARISKLALKRSFVQPTWGNNFKTVKDG